MRVAEQFSIVIEGRGLSGAAKDRYEMTVNGMVHGIGSTKVGKILLHWIKNSGTQRDWVLIAPYTKDLQTENGVCNALAWDDLWPIQIGRREIMATKINFSPETFMKSPCNADPVSSPLEVLVHELVHAQRSVSRIMKDVRLTGAMAGYENEEEYFAIVFTNVYSSVHAVGTTASGGLRADHSSGKLPSAEEDSEVFLSNRDNYRLIKKYCEQQTRLTREVAALPVKFNPFRTYYEWKAKNVVVR